jgi:hypothetical protein
MDGTKKGYRRAAVTRSCGTQTHGRGYMDALFRANVKRPGKKSVSHLLR